MQLKQLVGDTFTDNFEEFDLAVVQQVLASLSTDQAIDIAHSEKLQQKTLFRCRSLDRISRQTHQDRFLPRKQNELRQE